MFNYIYAWIETGLNYHKLKYFASEFCLAVDFVFLFGVKIMKYNE